MNISKFDLFSKFDGMQITKNLKFKFFNKIKYVYASSIEKMPWDEKPQTVYGPFVIVYSNDKHDIEAFEESMTYFKNICVQYYFKNKQTFDANCYSNFYKFILAYCIKCNKNELRNFLKQKESYFND